MQVTHRKCNNNWLMSNIKRNLRAEVDNNYLNTDAAEQKLHILKGGFLTHVQTNRRVCVKCRQNDHQNSLVMTKRKYVVHPCVQISDKLINIQKRVAWVDNSKTSLVTTMNA